MPLNMDTISASIVDWQKDFQYQFVLESFPEALSPYSTPLAISPGSNPVTKAVSKAVSAIVATLTMPISFAAMEVTIPESKSKDIHLNWAGAKRWFSGPDDDPGFFKVKFRIPSTTWMMDFFQGWRSIRMSSYNSASLPKSKTTGKAKILCVNNNGVLVNTSYSFEGVYVYEIGPQQFKQDGSGIQTVDITFNYDRKFRNKTGILEF